MRTIFKNIVRVYFSNFIYVHTLLLLFNIVLIALPKVLKVNIQELSSGGKYFVITNALTYFEGIILTLIVYLDVLFSSKKMGLYLFGRDFLESCIVNLDALHHKILNEIHKIGLSILFVPFMILGLALLDNPNLHSLNIFNNLYSFALINFCVCSITILILTLKLLATDESLSPHQSKEEILYEELRTRFASHNIIKDVRNLKSYITILKHEEPQLLAKFTTLDELTDMVEDTLSKFKNSDTIRTKNPFLIHELFDNFLILNKPDLVREGSDLQIEFQKPEFKDIEIHQIFYEVYQVLNNLIDNARKAIAHAERKEIQILTSVSKVGFVDFQVSDTGVGIEAKARNRVFDIGYSTTNGDGLGLLFVQTTLKRFGGEIQLLPTALSGFSTTFEVRIPTQKT